MSVNLAADELGAGALDWLVDSSTRTASGLAWTGTPDDPELDPTLYSGGAGIVLAMLEGYRHFGNDRYAGVAVRGSHVIAEAVDLWEHCGLYSGLAGMTVALDAVHRSLGDRTARDGARRGLSRLHAAFNGERWSDQVELMGGNAGIALAALMAGDTELATKAVTPYTWMAEPTAAGVTWEVRAGLGPRFHHISHGTLGIAYALASVGRATGRDDFTDLALAGTADVVARNETDEAGFLVPHSDPQHLPELVERYSYGWCHGPAGDAQLFRHLHALTGGDEWSILTDRCWHTVTHSGLPERLRPGFWDNNGRCCGTAGVLALACDRHVELGGDLSFARRLVRDLAERATVDQDGARWSNVEHRATPSTLQPRRGWAMGSAGIARELLRFTRISQGGDASYAFQWPDQPIAHPVAACGV